MKTSSLPVKFSNEIVNYQFFGLRESQALLYVHLEKCSKNKEVIDMKYICYLYFNLVRNPNDYFDRNGRRWYVDNKPDHPFANLRNKDAYEFLSKSEEYNNTFIDVVLRRAKMWLISNIGQLVGRGLLSVIPNINTKKMDTQRLDDAYEKYISLHF